MSEKITDKSGRHKPPGFLLFTFIFFFLFCYTPCLAEENSDYISFLIESSKKKKLSEDPYWHILLHYKKTFSGIESVVDDPSFFLSGRGKKDPQAELEALINTYFDNEKTDSAPPVCKYIARYIWVKEQLDPDNTKIPDFSCPAAENLSPKKATLVFPTYYLNSPASMFGHTFITIETGFESTLLTNAVNYAADPENSNALEYTIYGIFGGFKGYFSILPYYRKIQQYSYMDQRDIWEYQLNLTEQELKKMVLHIQELEGIYSDYYFFKENCSYHLLFLLEAARPSLKLSDSFSAWTVPIDTIKKMMEQGVIASSQFRPSNGTKIRRKLVSLTKEEQNVVYDVCHGQINPGDVGNYITEPEREIIARDLIGEYLKYRLIKHEITKEQYQAVVLTNLRMRSRLGTETAEAKVVTADPPDPATGHDTSRIMISAGVSDGETFQAAGINPAFTDLLNTDYTRNEGVELRVFDFELRYENDSEKVRLEKLDILEIVSLFPRNRFFKPLSWKISTGLRREYVEKEKKKNIFRVNSGTGYSFNFPAVGLVYAMPELELRAGKGLDHNAAAGIGASFGIMKDILPWWGMHLTANAFYFSPGHGYRENRITFDQNFKIDRNNRIRLTAARKESFGHDYYESSLSWYRFF